MRKKTANLTAASIIAHRLTYNSNHIERSRLTKEQTRYIFETNTLGITTENTRIDDIMETVNHFRCIDYIIDHATDKITEAHIKHLHLILKTNTSDSQKSWFAVGDYKKLANEVGGEATVQSHEVSKRMSHLLAEYNSLQKVELDHILNFHVLFERTNVYLRDICVTAQDNYKALLNYFNIKY